jgi:hypothetical protein
VEGNEDFIGCDFSKLAQKLKIGDHIVNNYGKAFLKVIGFQGEDEFLEQMENKHGEKELGRHVRSLRQRGAVSTMGRTDQILRSK